MRRGRLIVLVSLGVIWLTIAGVIIWREGDRRRQGERNRALLANTTWVSGTNTNEILSITNDKYLLTYYPGAGRSRPKPVEYSYTVEGDTITLQGENVFKLKIKLLTRDDLFLIDEKGAQLHWVRWQPGE